jgi:hypothetical protein
MEGKKNYLFILKEGKVEKIVKTNYPPIFKGKKGWKERKINCKPLSLQTI